MTLGSWIDSHTKKTRDYPRKTHMGKNPEILPYRINSTRDIKFIDKPDSIEARWPSTKSQSNPPQIPRQVSSNMSITRSEIRSATDL